MKKRALLLLVLLLALCGLCSCAAMPSGVYETADPLFGERILLSVEDNTVMVTTKLVSGSIVYTIDGPTFHATMGKLFDLCLQNADNAVGPDGQVVWTQGTASLTSGVYSTTGSFRAEQKDGCITFHLLMDKASFAFTLDPARPSITVTDDDGPKVFRRTGALPSGFSGTYASGVLLQGSVILTLYPDGTFAYTAFHDGVVTRNGRYSVADRTATLTTQDSQWTMTAVLSLDGKTLTLDNHRTLTRR